MLRSGMMGWLTVMQDTNAWTPEEHAAAKQEFALYKEKLRPLIRDADLYHISARPDGVHWDGIEYFDAAARNGRGVCFPRLCTGRQGAHLSAPWAPAGPAIPSAFPDGSSSDRTESGHELMSKGLSMALSVPNSSELVFMDEVR